jgi:deoxyribodipyrimidine photo-lyase
MEERVRKLNDAPARDGGRYVLYWMRWNRRAESNHALAFAASQANRLRLPLLVFESEDQGSDRQRQFVRDGASGNAEALRKAGIGYAFGHPRDVPRWTSEAAIVVTDEWPLEPAPVFDCEAYAVDSSCIVPASVIPARAYAARSIRGKLHRELPRFLKPVPRVTLRVKFDGALAGAAPVDVPSGAAGRAQAKRVLLRFLRERLHRYAAEKNEPSAHATSELSAHLHFGHISSLEVALAVREYAAEHRLIADAFLEELIVRRELAFNFARYATRVDSIDELPEWARLTLDAHRADTRAPLYTPRQFEDAATYDNLWNATQHELLRRGRIHGYYRMYWGKKILEWSATPEEALATMIGLHDRYALDARDPNTYANILWCLGLHDRPWPRRPIYGTVRSMSRAGMERKTGVGAYLREIEALQ